MPMQQFYQRRYIQVSDIYVVSLMMLSYEVEPYSEVMMEKEEKWSDDNGEMKILSHARYGKYATLIWFLSEEDVG